MASRILAALLLFALVNLTWAIVGYGKLPPDDFVYETWTSCAITDFLHGIKHAPDIAFLGSSLMLFPAGGVDADLLNKEIDGPRHHSSLYFEKKFMEQTGQKVSTFNFALPGEMPSDAYLITKFLLQGEKQPEVLVYGVGPRDFMDNLLPSPSATDPFRHLCRFGDYSTQIDKISPDWQDRLNYELGRLCFPYGHKEDLSHSFDRTVGQMEGQFLLTRAPIVPMKIRRHVLPDYRPCEVGPDECMFRPYVDRPRPAFSDNLVEYRKRYKVLNWDTFLTQMDFLSRIIDTTKERGIKFVLVSMPITDLNRGLIGKTAAIAFKKTLRVLAETKNVSFIELDGSKDYQLSDFEDTVHLHSGGGRKMLSAIAQNLARDTEIRQALGATSPSLHSEPGGPAPSKQVATRKESFL